MDSISHEDNSANDGEQRIGLRNGHSFSPVSIRETDNDAIEFIAPNAGDNSTQAVANASSLFNFFVGSNGRHFTVDINELRRESALFGDCRCITSIELRHEDPDAVQLIKNWFSGNIGHPPITEDGRNLFANAARIAAQLQIMECANQLLVINHKTTTFLRTILLRQAQGATNYSSQEVIELVEVELQGYMTRSTNVGCGGGDDCLENEFDTSDNDEA